MILRLLLITLGTLSLIVGVIGIFLPGLPTTPFLLLTAGLYVRSSDRLYQLLIRNRYVGAYLTRWQADKKLPRKTKLYSMLLMWVMISLSVIFFIDNTTIRMVITGIGLIGTLVMGFIIPTRSGKED